MCKREPEWEKLKSAAGKFRGGYERSTSVPVNKISSAKEKEVKPGFSTL